MIYILNAWAVCNITVGILVIIMNYHQIVHPFSIRNISNFNDWKTRLYYGGLASTVVWYIVYYVVKP